MKGTWKDKLFQIVKKPSTVPIPYKWKLVKHKMEAQLRLTFEFFDLGAWYSVWRGPFSVAQGDLEAVQTTQPAGGSHFQMFGSEKEKLEKELMYIYMNSHSDNQTTSN